MKKRILEYVISFSAFLLLSFVIAILFGLFSYKEDYRIYEAICNGLFISAVFSLSIGGLLFVHNNGFFEIIIYGIFRFITLFTKRRKYKYETFYDYHVAQAEKPKAEYGYFLVVGLFYLVVSLLFLYLWANASGEI